MKVLRSGFIPATVVAVALSGCSDVVPGPDAATEQALEQPRLFTVQSSGPDRIAYFTRSYGRRITLRDGDHKLLILNGFRGSSRSFAIYVNRNRSSSPFRRDDASSCSVTLAENNQRTTALETFTAKWRDSGNNPTPNVWSNYRTVDLTYDSDSDYLLLGTGNSNPTVIEATVDCAESTDTPSTGQPVPPTPPRGFSLLSWEETRHYYVFDFQWIHTNRGQAYHIQQSNDPGDTQSWRTVDRYTYSGSHLRHPYSGFTEYLTRTVYLLKSTVDIDAVEFRIRASNDWGLGNAGGYVSPVGIERQSITATQLRHRIDLELDSHVVYTLLGSTNTDPKRSFEFYVPGASSSNSCAVTFDATGTPAHGSVPANHFRAQWWSEGYANRQTYSRTYDGSNDHLELSAFNASTITLEVTVEC